MAYEIGEAWLCDAGVTAFRQVNRKWRNRSHLSDGWLGDYAHSQTESDHNPCWSCPGRRRGVVRAIDIDTSFGGGPIHGSSEEAHRLANQFRKDMINGAPIDYIIHDRKIANLEVQNGEWREYYGDNPHVSHMHLSFTEKGDFWEGKFDCPILVVD